MDLEQTMDSEIMTVKEVDEYLKSTKMTAYRFASGGKISGLKVGGAWRFRRSEVETWFDRQSAVRNEYAP